MFSENQLQIALIEAAKKGNIEQIREIVPKLKELNWKDAKTDEEDNFSGATALHYAAEKNQAKAVSELIKLGFKVDVYDDSFWPPLFYAIDNGNLEVTRILVTEGNADLLIKGKTPGGPGSEGINMGITPLHMATGFAATEDSEEKFELFKFLLETFNQRYVLNRKTPLVDINSIVSNPMIMYDKSIRPGHTILDCAYGCMTRTFMGTTKNYQPSVLSLLEKSGLIIKPKQFRNFVPQTPPDFHFPEGPSNDFNNGFTPAFNQKNGGGPDLEKGSLEEPRQNFQKKL